MGSNEDTAKVAEELSKPGTHVGPDFVPPQERRYRKKIDAQWERRESRRRVYLGSHPERSGETRPPASESFESLLRANVPVRQIALMKRCTEAEVFDRARELGLQADGAPAPPPVLSADQHLARRRQVEADRMAAAADRAAANAEPLATAAPETASPQAASPQAASTEAASDNASGIDTYPELGSVKERVRQLTFDGHGPAAIHQLLRGELPELKMGTVSNYARNAAKEVEAE